MLRPDGDRGPKVTHDLLVTNLGVSDTAAAVARPLGTAHAIGLGARNPRVIGVLVAAVAMLVTGCGGDGTSLKGDSTSPTPTSDSSTTSTSMGDASTTTADTDMTSTTTDGSSTTGAEKPTGGSIEFTTADGRTTRFGGFQWKIEGITIGVAAGAAPTDEPAVTVDLLATNVTDGDLTMIESPLMRYGADPVEVSGTLTSKGGYPTATAGAAARASYAFELPPDSTATEAALTDAVLIFGSEKVLRAGIPLDGDAIKPPAVEATPVNATLPIAGDANGDLTVVSVLPALDAEKTTGGTGTDDEALDFRAATDGVWLAFDVKLDCRGGTSGQDCYFGLEQDVIRVEVDGVAEGFETADSDLFEITDAMSPGSSTQVLPQLMVRRGKSYALLLGDPKDPASVKKVPLNIGPAVDSLYASVADFQTK